MADIFFTSELSTFSTSSTVLTVTNPAGAVIFQNRYDATKPVEVIGLNRIVEQDMRRRRVFHGTYIVDGKAMDLYYRALPDDGVKAVDFAKDHFLCGSGTFVFPPWHSEDVRLPIFCEGAETCVIRVGTFVNGAVSMSSLNYPVAAGGDVIVAYAENVSVRPSIYELCCGERRLSLLFAGEDDVLSASGATDKFHVVTLGYLDAYGMMRYESVPAVRSHQPSADRVTAVIGGKLRVVSAVDTSTVTLTVTGLSYEKAVELMGLLTAFDTVAWSRDPVSGGIVREEITVTDVSGDFSDEPGKLNTVKISYRV